MYIQHMHIEIVHIITSINYKICTAEDLLVSKSINHGTPKRFTLQ